MRDTNFPPLSRSLDFPPRSRPALQAALPAIYPAQRTISNYMIFCVCEAGKFYCDINYFICEWTDRLLREELFYLRVEFSLACVIGQQCL
jgi:hypothetical protein